MEGKGVGIYEGMAEEVVIVTWRNLIENSSLNVSQFKATAATVDLTFSVAFLASFSQCTIASAGRTQTSNDDSHLLI